MEIKDELRDLREKITLLEAQPNLTDEEVERLEGWTLKARQLTVRLNAQEQAAILSADEEKRREKEKQDAVDTAVKAEQAKNRRLQMGDIPAPYQTQYQDTAKFDNLTAGETALVIESLNTQGKQVSGAALKALSLKIGELKDRTNTEEGERNIRYVKAAFKAYTGIDASPEATAAAVKAATDPMYTGGSGIGSDWVGTAYSSEIWAAIRAGNNIVGRIPSSVIPDGYSSMYWPLEGADPTWYKVAEATASDSTLKVPAATITASQMATANKQITIAKLGARALYTGELTEDSLIQFAPQLRKQLEKSGADVLEHVAIDGDVETSANKNINIIAGTPGGTEPYLIMDGFRKLALVTNTANARSAGGAFVIEDFKNTLKLMGTAGLAGADPNMVSFILDYNTMWAAMDIPEIKTKDVSSAATIENGFLTRAYRTEVLYAFQMHKLAADRKANTAGKVDQASSGVNNTTGALLAVRWDQWKQAFKRRMTLETTRIANADSWEIVALVRWGLAYRDTEASAITYNIGV